MIIVQVDVPTVPPEPPPIVHPVFGFGIRLIGTDTTDWDLAQGPVYALAGLKGFGAPDAEHWWRETAAFDGSDHLGLRIPMRPVELPVEVKASTEAEWLDADRLLAKGLDPRGECRLIVTTPDAVSRYLPMRYVRGLDTEIEIDPMLDQQSVYPLELAAGDPYWRGAEVVTRFVATTPVAFFPGPPFVINEDNTVATALVTNPGDEPAWGTWVIDGPYTSATVGIGASLVTLSTPILAGQQRVIDMNPRAQTIVDENGVDCRLEATVVKFVPIPAGVNVELNLNIVGSAVGTRIELRFDPRFRRAW